MAKRVLCLHGMRQNSDLVAGDFRALLAQEEAEFMNGVHKPSTPLPENMAPFRSIFGDFDKGTSFIWWNVEDDGTYRGCEETMEAVMARVKETKPRVMAGFSQGASVTLIYLLECALRNEDPGIHYAIACAPPLVRHPPLQERLKTIGVKVKVPVLFFFGQQDDWCPYKKEAWTTFMDSYFETWSVHEFQGGHVVPTDPASIAKAKAFLASS